MYCPTKEMIADFFKQPLHGMHLNVFMDFIMNVASVSMGIQDQRIIFESKDTSDDGSKESGQDCKGDNTSKRRKRLHMQNERKEQ